VVWIRRASEIRLMAGIASCGHGLELAIGHALVARVAVYRRVRPGQREPVVVLLDLLDRYPPSPDRVALLAVCSQLPLVNVRVAILASLSDAGKNRLHVALNAGHGLVHAAQRVLCSIVIEFRYGTDGLPSRCRVAVLTRDVQIAVWTVRTCGGLRLRAS